MPSSSLPSCGSTLHPGIVTLTSVWPLNISVGPPPVPRSRPIAWRVALPFSVGCSTVIICTSMPMPRMRSARKSATAPSPKFGLGILIMSRVSFTSASSWIAATTLLRFSFM
jgi:hypothetical protein